MSAWSTLSFVPSEDGTLTEGQAREIVTLAEQLRLDPEEVAEAITLEHGMPETCAQTFLVYVETYVAIQRLIRDGRWSASATPTPQPGQEVLPPIDRGRGASVREKAVNERGAR